MKRNHLNRRKKIDFCFLAKGTETMLYFTGTRCFWTLCTMTACLHTSLAVPVSYCSALNYFYLYKAGIWLSNSTGQCPTLTVPYVTKKTQGGRTFWVGIWSAKDQHSNTWVLYPALPQTLSLILGKYLKLRLAQRFGTRLVKTMF